MNQFNLQDVCNAVWAFDMMIHAALEVVEAVAKTALERLEDFNPQDISNIVLAFALMTHAANDRF